MPNFEKHPLHIKTPELHKSEEVSRAIVRQEERTGDKLSNDPTTKIETYISRLENIFLNPDTRVRQRNLELYRDKIYDTLIIKPENFPESYFELQKKVARERGQAVEEIPENVREQMMDIAIADQKASLDAWMDYLSSEDAVYPAWFKYYAWNNIIKLSQFDKERGEFKKRTKSTVAPFPDIYREPLAQIADLYEQIRQDNKNLSDEEVRRQFSQKFPSLYAELIQKSLATQIENKEEIKGEWVKYEQGDNSAAEQLFKSLENKGTGWCTAGQSTAQSQIKSGDFYVYYTNDASGNPTQPRLAIRMDGQDKIGEVRGILPHQNVEPIMQETLDEKLQSFGSEADRYRKKTSDMKQLTGIEIKIQEGKELTKVDLIFLYEINTSIDGFGYQKDPRIKELLNERNILADAETIYECDFNNPGKKELELIYGVGDKSTPPAFFETMKRLRQGRNIESDMLLIFECQPNQIIRSQQELQQAIKEKKEIKAYVGELFPNFFKVIPQHIEHIYTEFPEGKIKQKTIELGTGLKTKAEFVNAIEQQDSGVGDFAKDIMSKAEFVVSNKEAKEDLIILTVKALGFPSGATVKEIFERAKSLGLELCPPETGPQLRLQYPEQPIGEWCRIGMEPISDSGGDPDLFIVLRNDGKPWLFTNYGGPGLRYASDSLFAFVRASNS